MRRLVRRLGSFLRGLWSEGGLVRRCLVFVFFEDEVIVVVLSVLGNFNN